jgi:hypothetical protein
MTKQTDLDRSSDRCNPDIDKSVESLSLIRRQKPFHSDGLLHTGSLGHLPELKREQTVAENFGLATVEVELTKDVTEKNKRNSMLLSSLNLLSGLILSTGFPRYSRRLLS